MLTPIGYRRLVEAYEKIEHEAEKSGLQVSTALSLIGQFIGDSFSDTKYVKEATDHELYIRKK